MYSDFFDICNTSFTRYTFLLDFDRFTWYIRYTIRFRFFGGDLVLRVLLKYRHPVTGNYYYFVDYRRLDNGDLKPVGCMRYRRRNAMVFETKRDAKPVFEYLVSIGYSAVRMVKSDV